MSAALLARAAEAGLSLWLEENKVRWRAPRPPAPDLLADLRANRDAVSAALAAEEVSRRRRDVYEERAAIMEFDGTMARSEAEARACAGAPGKGFPQPQPPPKQRDQDRTAPYDAADPPAARSCWHGSTAHGGGSCPWRWCRS